MTAAVILFCSIPVDILIDRHIQSLLLTSYMIYR